MSEGFYDGTKLLSMQDLEGRRPEIYLCTTNKSAGKTTFFSRLCVNRWKDSRSKFMLLYRFTYELDDCADKFFKDIGSLFFPDFAMTSARKSNGIYHELLINDEPSGYAVALNNADAIKKMSHLFSDVDRMFMDEFQSETNHYCNEEVKKFRAVHTAVARGQHKHTRYVPVYMCSNPVTLLNPYYTALGIAPRLRDDTRFLRGNGFVLEQGFNESAAKAQKESAFNRAFGDDKYNAYQFQAVYLSDSKSFIERPDGIGNYMCTLKYMGSYYAIRRYPEYGIVYCDDRADMTFPQKIAVTTDDHQINYVMLKSNSIFLSTLRYFFEHGCFRFRDLQCKEAIMQALAYI